MAKDENPEVPVLPQENEPEQPEGNDPENPEPETPEQPEKDDYRGKLNANIRFLKSEGYTFNEASKRWEKPGSVPAGSEPKPEQSASAQSLTREEAFIIAKGYSETELEKMKKIAAVEGIKLTDVPANDIFTTWKAQQDAAAKRQEAQLGTPRGGRSSVKKDFNTPGLSDDEHRRLFQERNK